MSPSTMYVIGFCALVIGLSLAASMLGVPTVWIGIGVLILAIVVALSGISRKRRRRLGRP